MCAAAAATRTPEQEAELEQPITEKIAKSFGIPYDPADPPRLKDVLQDQFARSVDLLKTTQTDSAAMLKKARDKILKKDESNLTQQQQLDVEQITSILNQYPTLLIPTKIYLATLLRRTMDISALMNADPSTYLAMMDTLQEVLMQKIPKDKWPTSLRPAPSEPVQETQQSQQAQETLQPQGTG